MEVNPKQTIALAGLDLILSDEGPEIVKIIWDTFARPKGLPLLSEQAATIEALQADNAQLAQRLRDATKELDSTKKRMQAYAALQALDDLPGILLSLRFKALADDSWASLFPYGAEIDMALDLCRSHSPAAGIPDLIRAWKSSIAAENPTSPFFANIFGDTTGRSREILPTWLESSSDSLIDDEYSVETFTLLLLHLKSYLPNIPSFDGVTHFLHPMPLHVANGLLCIPPQWMKTVEHYPNCILGAILVDVWMVYQVFPSERLFILHYPRGHFPSDIRKDIRPLLDLMDGDGISTQEWDFSMMAMPLTDGSSTDLGASSLFLLNSLYRSGSVLGKSLLVPRDVPMSIREEKTQQLLRLLNHRAELDRILDALQDGTLYRMLRLPQAWSMV